MIKNGRNGFRALHKIDLKILHDNINIYSCKFTWAINVEEFTVATLDEENHAKTDWRSEIIVKFLLWVFFV